MRLVRVVSHKWRWVTNAIRLLLILDRPDDVWFPAIYISVSHVSICCLSFLQRPNGRHQSSHTNRETSKVDHVGVSIGYNDLHSQAMLTPKIGEGATPLDATPVRRVGSTQPDVIRTKLIERYKAGATPTQQTPFEYTDTHCFSPDCSETGLNTSCK